MSTVLFKDWLPDQPDLNNPGMTEASNVLPVGDTPSGYSSFAPLLTFGSALTSTSTLNHIATLALSTAGNTYAYVGTQDGHLYQSLSTVGTWTDFTGAITQPVTALVQYNDLIFAACEEQGLYYHTVGSSSTFGAAVGSPHARVLGVVGQFLMAGNITALPKVYPHLLGWSSIAAPTDWPTPGSDSALASQAGEQFLHLELGAITGIFGGDQWGIVLQENGVTRMTYTGGAGVFQFDTLSAGVGMDAANCGVKIGNRVYFVCSRGVFATDGVTVDPIGEGKVNRWVIANLTGNLPSCRVAVDWTNKIIYWVFVQSAASAVLLYNYATGRFAHATDTNAGPLVASNLANFLALGAVVGMSQNNKLGYFSGIPGTAILTTGESELTPGGYTRISGLKPLIGATTNAMVSSVGYRNDLQSGVTYATDTTQNSRSGFADFRIESRYARARVKVTGAFTNAQGLEFNAIPGGSV